MKTGPILFLEESRPPRPLTWSLVVLAVGAIVDTDGKLSAEQPTLYVLYVIAGSLLTILFLEFVAISVEVTLVPRPILHFAVLPAKSSDFEHLGLGGQDLSPR